MTKMLKDLRWWCHRNVLNVGGGSHDVLFGVSIYGNRFYSRRWFQLTVLKVYHFACRMHRIRMWVAYRTTRRDCWDIPADGLDPGYYDCDTLMLHGCMGLLCRYVEVECGGARDLEKFTAELRQPGSEGHGPREIVETQAESQGDAIAIYRWWRVSRPADLKRRDELVQKLYGRNRMKSNSVDDGKLHQIEFEPFEGNELQMNEELRDLENKIYREEQEMLHRLIDIRGSLWT